MRQCLLVILLLTSCEKEVVTEAVRPVKTIQVSEASSVDNQQIFPGTLRAFQHADLSFRVDGTLIMRNVYVGYRAQKNETLVQLDPREYEIALQKAGGKIGSVSAQLDFAVKDYARMQKIYSRDPGAISDSLLDRKKETSNQLKAELTIAEGDFDQAADNLSYASLKAPFDGIIAAIYVENHEQVRAKQAVLRFLDIADREMEINVPEKFINALLEGKDRLNFEILLDAFPNRVFNASIKEIGTEASSTTQTYPVTLSLQKIPYDVSLLAGMSGRAILKQSTENLINTFKIPQSAIFTDDGRATFVWIIDPNTQTVQKKAVKVDGSNKGNIFVKEGLASGDWIVTGGTSFLIEGQRVRFEQESTKP
ncbi:MAG: efflux RND transporter periplasmic adaptor subunit [Parachlamydiaceae bacterium]|nr:efflux RND transporter periplasmic adaptor subunit [Parachlamydiaceae bacterium]